MKNLIKKISILLIILLVLTSCNNVEGPSKSPIPSPIVESPLPSEDSKREIIYDEEGNIDYEASWRGKKVLVWKYFDSQGVSTYLGQYDRSEDANLKAEPIRKLVDDSLLLAYNDYLVSIGSKYVVKFEGTSEKVLNRLLEDYLEIDKEDRFSRNLFTSRDTYSYFVEELEEMKKDGEEVDLILMNPYGGYSMTDVVNGVKTTVSGKVVEEIGVDEINRGLLLDISGYVFEGEDSRIRDTYPDYYWNLFNKFGGIYGFYNTGILSTNVYYLNEDMVSKHDTKFLNPKITIDELETFIDLLYEENKDSVDKQEVTLVGNDTNSTYYQQLIGIYSYVPDISTRDAPLISFKYDSDNNAQVINRFKDDNLFDLYESLSRMVLKGYFNGSESKYEDPETFYTDPNLVPKHYTLPKLTYIVPGFNDLSSSSLVGDYIPFEISDYYLMSARGTLIGISSWTKEPSLAYDFFATLLTDPYLTNLMLYGEDYKLENGYVNQRQNYSTMAFGISFLAYPETKGSKGNLDLEQALENMIVPPGYAFQPDYTGMEYDFEKISDLCKRADTIWGEDPQNWKVTMKALIKQLEEVGYDEFLEEISLQYDSFYNSLLYEKEKNEK